MEMAVNETELIDALHEASSRAAGLRELLEAHVSGSKHTPLGKDAVVLLAEAAGSIEEAVAEALSAVPEDTEARAS